MLARSAGVKLYGRAMLGNRLVKPSQGLQRYGQVAAGERKIGPQLDRLGVCQDCCAPIALLAKCQTQVVVCSANLGFRRIASWNSAIAEANFSCDWRYRPKLLRAAAKCGFSRSTAESTPTLRPIVLAFAGVHPGNFWRCSAQGWPERFCQITCNRLVHFSLDFMDSAQVVMCRVIVGPGRTARLENDPWLRPASSAL